MKQIGHRALTALIIALAMASAGCSVLSPQPDRSRFFVLVPSANSHNVGREAVPGTSSNFTVGLGPITIPRYLRRPQIVTRISDTELAISDSDRWAEPLDTCVPSVLAQDLSADLPGSQIVQFPWPEKRLIRYSVAVDFLRLERTADGKANVKAIWKIRGPGDRLVDSGVTVANLPAGDSQTLASTALSDGVGQVGREIAQALARQFQIEAKRAKPPPS